MKLLVTDYDGTLKSDVKNLRLNIKAINEFRTRGNKFAIATGRSYESIKKEIELFKIDYDYLICNNGLIIFDSNNNIINSFCLADKDLDFIYNSVKENKQIRKFELYNFYTSTNDLNNILEIFVKFKNAEGAKKYKKELESTMKNILCNIDMDKLFISNNINKSDAVSIIKKLENIALENIYTVGDDINDIEMLKKFNGYKMLASYPTLWLKKLPVTREVHTLVKKIK